MKLVANREIAFVSKQQSLTKTDPSVKSWKPKCVANPDYPADGSGPALETEEDPATWKYLGISWLNADGEEQMSRDCFTDEEAQKKVKEDYVVVNLDYIEFKTVINEKVEAMPLATMLGTLGGNLGLFMGFSIMTIVEWIEMLVFFALGVPLFFFRFTLLPFYRRELDDGGDDVFEDEGVQKVMKNIKKIAAEKSGQNVSGASFGADYERAFCAVATSDGPAETPAERVSRAGNTVTGAGYTKGTVGTTTSTVCFYNA